MLAVKSPKSIEMISGIMNGLSKFHGHLDFYIRCTSGRFCFKAVLEERVKCSRLNPSGSTKMHSNAMAIQTVVFELSCLGAKCCMAASLETL